jgi:hypothetical protein
MGRLGPAGRMAGVLVTVAAGSLASGCDHTHNFRAAMVAKHSPSVQGGATTRAGVSPPVFKPTRGAVTRTHARAFARVVNLTLADVPGAAISRHQKESAAERREDHCSGEGDGSQVIAEADSPSFVRGAGLTRETLSSGVTVGRSAAVAQAAIAFVASATGRACYARILRQHLAPQSSAGVSVQSVDVTALPVTLPVPSFGVRILATLRTARSRLSIRLYSDLLGFAAGQSEITFEATSLVQPEPRKTEEELLKLMLERARTSTL